MSRFQIQKNMGERGFTLLLAVLVGVVILTIGLTILNSSLKQQQLAQVALESERSFHAAYAGVECAQFWNVADVWDVGTGTQSIRCMEQGVTTVTEYSGSGGPNNEHERKTIEFDWQNADSADGTYTYEMCTRMTVYKYFDASSPTTIEVLPTTVGSDLRTCNVGVECTVVEARGYNRNCASLADIRTVEREITVRF